jgi:histidine triad (HIT) family protein
LSCSILFDIKIRILLHKKITGISASIVHITPWNEEPRNQAKIFVLLKIYSTMEDANCVFCRIVSNKTQARIIDENDNALAFLDAFPLSVGHSLVIPKRHYSKVQDMNSTHSCAVFNLACKLAAVLEKTVKANASTIAIHNGKDAGQEVPHVHVHIVPRSVTDGAGPIHSMFSFRPKVSEEEMDLLVKKVKKSLNI